MPSTLLRRPPPLFFAFPLLKPRSRPLHRNLLHTRSSPTSSTPTPTTAPILLPTSNSTEYLGCLLGQCARPGDIIFLYGTLGAGKTSFARGFIRAARQDPTLEVTSPTYLLSNTYPRTKPAQSIPNVTHMDLWRIEDARKRPIVDFEKVFREVALIEWPDRLGWKPEVRLDVLLEYPKVDRADKDDPWGFDSLDNASGRFASLTPVGGSWPTRIAQLLSQYADPANDGNMTLRES